MAVFFRTPLTDTLAFEMLDARLSSGTDFDGYFNIYGREDELTVTWTRGISAGAFKEQVTDALRSTWQRARFWLVYQRSDSRNDLDIKNQNCRHPIEPRLSRNCCRHAQLARTH